MPSSLSRKERRKASRRNVEVVATFCGGLDFKSHKDFDFAHLRYHCAECGCGEEGTHLLCCSKCKERKYCGKKCQTAAWKRVHKPICGKTSGFPTIQKLKESSFCELAVTLDEWGGCCPSITYLIDYNCCIKPDLVQAADPLDVLHIASSISRLIDNEEPDTPGPYSSLALRLLTHSDSEECRAIAATPLFGSIIHRFLAAPRLSDLCDIEDMNKVRKHVLIHGKVMSALSLHLEKIPMDDYSLFHTNLSRCADATMQALATYHEFRNVRSDVHAGGEKQDFSARNRLAIIMDEDSLFKCVLTLASTLANRGFASLAVEDVKSIFEADMHKSLESDDVLDVPNAVARWASLAGNISRKCDVDGRKLVKVVDKFIRAHFGNNRRLLNLLDR